LIGFDLASALGSLFDQERHAECKIVLQMPSVNFWNECG